MADDGFAQDPLSPEDAAFAAVFPNGLPATRAASASAIVRSFPLTEEHLVKLRSHAESGRTLGGEGTANHRLATIKRRHHRLAMLLAGGMEPERAAMACGYHPTTGGILCQDPMFAQLLDLYSEGVIAEFQDTIVEMKDLADDLLGELRTRLDADPRQFTVGQINDLIRTLADRSGTGPSSTVTQLGISLNGADVANIKAEAAGGGAAGRQSGRLTEGHQRAIEGVFAVRGTGSPPGVPPEGISRSPGDGLRTEGAVPPGGAMFADDAEEGGVD